MAFKGIISNKNEIEALEEINVFINGDKQHLSNTFHEFESNFPSHMINFINTIKEGTIKCQIQLNNNKNILKVGILPISNMNELYISSIGAGGSDKVFETDHLDGPFFFLPFCKVYRCIACINANSSIYTSFPITGEKYFLQKNEFLAFDYNRDIHSICQDSTIIDDSPRILLKLHYIVYPTYLPMFVVNFYIKLHVKYNNFMRFLFIRSQIPGKESGRSLTSSYIDFDERSSSTSTDYLGFTAPPVPVKPSKEFNIYDETIFERNINKIYDIYRNDMIIKNGLAYVINFGTVAYCGMFSIVSKLFLKKKNKL